MKIILLLFICLCTSLTGQIDLSLTTQVYPTGIIPGVQIDKIIRENQALSFRLGYQFIDHRDLGVHDDEIGEGIGFTIGYRRYSGRNPSKFFWALKNDIWWNNIEWYDLNMMGKRTNGLTDLTVLQPTAEIGIQIIAESGLFFSPTLAFGWEWNIKTNGEPTGQGAILLIGIQMGKRF